MRCGGFTIQFRRGGGWCLGLLPPDDFQRARLLPKIEPRLPDQCALTDTSCLNQGEHREFVMGTISCAVVVEVPSHRAAVMHDQGKNGKSHLPSGQPERLHLLLIEAEIVTEFVEQSDAHLFAKLHPVTARIAP